LQLTGKISLELDSNSSLLLEYGRKSTMLIKQQSTTEVYIIKRLGFDRMIWIRIHTVS